MSKQPNPPPPGDKPVGTAPPPPPGWRHGLWPIALIVALALFWLVPGIDIKTPVSLSYSQFTADASAHKIKTVVFGNGANGSNTPVPGTLTDGKSFTTVIPGPASPTFAQQLRAEGVQSVTATAPSSGLGTTILYWLFLLLPFIVVFWLFRRMSPARGGGLSGPASLRRGDTKAVEGPLAANPIHDV